jgi:hypothetical protein
MDNSTILEEFSYIIYQGTDILPEIFSSSPHTRVFVARKLHEGASPRVILSDKHECWTAKASKKAKYRNYYTIFNRCYCGVTRVAHVYEGQMKKSKIAKWVFDVRL